mmetsp:Transcript_58912/g.104719  ORF Transcript_58912/g.104719 Transcript_58912/m.104719 type:complete len:148 (-) Transcript_58912:33-476(-)
MAPLLEPPFEGLEKLPALHRAAWLDDAFAVEKLLAAGTEVDIRASWTTDTSYGSRFASVTALHVSVDAKAERASVALLRAGADLEAKMSQVEMGYHMGEGSYLDTWALAQRGGESAMQRLKELVSTAATKSDAGCLRIAFRGLCSRL